jgi:hypothetical protein
MSATAFRYTSPVRVSWMSRIFQSLGDSRLTSQHPLALGVASPAEAFLISVVILALLASFVGRSRGSLAAPHADASFDISFVVPAVSCLL